MSYFVLSVSFVVGLKPFGQLVSLRGFGIKDRDDRRPGRNGRRSGETRPLG